MKTVTKLLSVLLCAIICFSLITTVSAATTPTIKVTSTEAKVGDTVTIDLDITDNPGIMAMAFCITYDNKVLEYVEDSCKSNSSYTKTSLTVKNHPDKGHVAVVLVENKDNTKSDKILSLKFTVKNDVAGKHIISLANSNREKHGTKLHNSFSNSTQDFIIPKLISGGITVPETCENSGHKYGNWDIIEEANCTETGLREHSCVRCDFTEEEKIPITHDFEEEWTIDKAATPTEDGIMSRHCKKCDQVTDIITFSYEEIGDDNDSSSDTTDNNESNDNNSANTSSGSENIETDTSADSNSNTDNSSQGQKPNIENLVGEKVPLDEAQKFDDYKSEYGAATDNSSQISSDASSKETLSQENASKDDASDNSDAATGIIENSVTKDEEPSLFDTASGIVIAIICALLSIGIIALGILLIIKNKKQ